MQIFVMLPLLLLLSIRFLKEAVGMQEDLYDTFARYGEINCECLKTFRKLHFCERTKWVGIRLHNVTTSKNTFNDCNGEHFSENSMHRKLLFKQLRSKVSPCKTQILIKLMVSQRNGIVNERGNLLKSLCAAYSYCYCINI